MRDLIKTNHSVSVVDPDFGAIETATASLSAAGNGTLSITCLHTRQTQRSPTMSEFPTQNR